MTPRKNPWAYLIELLNPYMPTHKTRQRVALSWSSGKDRAWSLHCLRKDPGIEVVTLVTALNEAFNRVAVHAVRQELLHAQADAIGLPLIEQQLQGTGITPIQELARRMIDGGLRAVLTCVDPKHLAPEFCGREFNTALLDALPASVDPCGENGEFHSFACAGPMFAHRLRLKSARSSNLMGLCLLICAGAAIRCNSSAEQTKKRRVPFSITKQ
jgi:diphthamide synthase (EF-2-diphthine--ammonia ligase)